MAPRFKGSSRDIAERSIEITKGDKESSWGKLLESYERRQAPDDAPGTSNTWFWPTRVQEIEQSDTFQVT